MANQFRVLILITIFILINFCQGKKEWQQPKDVLPKVVKNDEDGLETILYDTPEGIWEIGNGQIWHQPKGEKAREVTKEYDPIKEEDIQKLIQKLKAKGQTNGNGSPSIRNFQFTSDSIRNTRGKSDSIRTKPATPSSIRNKNLSFRSTDSIRAASGKKEWIAPNEGKASLAIGNDDGIETIRFDSITGEIWEIGNGEIWHQPKGGPAREVTNEYKRIADEDIRKKIAILKKEGGKINLQDNPSFREFSSTSESIRNRGAVGGGGNAAGGPSPTRSIRTKTATPSGSIRNNGGGGVKPSDMHLPAGRTVRPADLPIPMKVPQRSGSIRNTNKKTPSGIDGGGPSRLTQLSGAISGPFGGMVENLKNMFHYESDSPPQYQPHQYQVPGYGGNEFQQHLPNEMIIDLSKKVNMPIVATFLNAIGIFLYQKRIDPMTTKFAGTFLDDVMDAAARRTFLEIMSQKGVDHRLYEMVRSIFTDHVQQLSTPKMQSRLSCWLLARILQELVDAMKRQGADDNTWKQYKINPNIVRQRINEVLEDNIINLTREENQQIVNMQNIVLLDMGKSIRMDKN